MSNKGRGRGVWGRISQVESRPGHDRNHDKMGEPLNNRNHDKMGETLNNRNHDKMGENHNNRQPQFHDYWDDKPLDGHDVLIELMEKLDIDKPNPASAQIIKRITKTVYDLCISPDSLSDMIHKLHDKSLEDKEFGRKTACVLGSVSQLEVGGVKLRDVLLRTIQTDFKKREEMRLKHPQILYNAVRLLCEVFKEVKLGDGSVISVLCVPILEYFQMLLEISSPASIQLLGQQLGVLGQDLQVAQADRIVKLMMKVRKGLVEGAKMGEGEKSVLLHLMELYLLRWPVLLPQNVEDWYETHREAFDCLVVVMDGETVTPIYSEKDWMGSGGGGKGKKEEKKVDLEQEKAITSMLREARISGDKEVKEESDSVKKRNKIAAKGGLWGRALQDLEAADKSDKDREDKASQGVERKREERAGSVGDIIPRPRGPGVGRGGRTGSVGQIENRSSGQASRNGKVGNDERKDNLGKRVSPIPALPVPALPVPACKGQIRWHDDRTSGHDNRTNGNDRTNSHDNRTNGHDDITNGHDDRTNGYDENRRDNANAKNIKGKDVRNTIGNGEERKGIKDRLGKVGNMENGRNGENKENSVGGDLRGRLNRMKTSPAAAGDWTGVGRSVTAGLVVNVSRKEENTTPELSPRNVSLSPPTPDTPDWKNEAPLEGNWADDLDDWD